MLKCKTKTKESNIYFFKKERKFTLEKKKVYFKYTKRNNRIYNRKKIMIIVNYVNLNSSTYLKGEKKTKSSNLTTPKLLRFVCHLGIICFN